MTLFCIIITRNKFKIKYLHQFFNDDFERVGSIIFLFQNLYKPFFYRIITINVV